MERNSSQVSCSRRNSWLTCLMPKHRSYMADWRMRSLQEDERKAEEELLSESSLSCSLSARLSHYSFVYVLYD